MIRVTSPAISVVVISRNEGSYLRSTIEGLEATLPANSEIVIVDDGSVDRSTDFLTNYRSVRLIVNKDLGVAKARNLGARQTTSEMIVFADAHISVPPCWWEPLWDALARANIGAAAPAISMLGDDTLKGYGLSLTGPDLDADWLPKTDREP